MKILTKTILALSILSALFLPLIPESQAYTIKLLEPISNQDNGDIRGETGLDIVNSYLSKVYTYAFGAAGVFCVVVIVFSGTQIVFGGINNSAVGEAKDRIFTALLSLILVILAGMILRFVNPGFFKASLLSSSTYFLEHQV